MTPFGAIIIALLMVWCLYDMINDEMADRRKVDELAANVGLKRKRWESDKALRKRIVNRHRSQSG